MNLKLTLETIVNSPKVSQYLVGLTKNSKDRRSSYGREGFDGYAVIDFSLTAEQALALEKELFLFCTSNKSSQLYKKYHKNKRDKSYHPSLGSTDPESEYHVYLAWF